MRDQQARRVGSVFLVHKYKEIHRSLMSKAKTRRTKGLPTKITK
uniref:Uncharacterized protein n=1 Tax=Nelumbo nucifera TaxID=4432 RepID=A0A822Y0Q0_NELNU|nr:TPA_asm: hypothetical protein HUJ06_026313 [Nelumbo nucifera]DAD24871.1 TPA_asm: hypothetical protein HUJ06_026335 [Nelumbo nucifera]